MTDVKRVAELSNKISEVSKKQDAAVRELKRREASLASNITSDVRRSDVKYGARSVERYHKELEKLKSDLKTAQG